MTPTERKVVLQRLGIDAEDVARRKAFLDIADRDIDRIAAHRDALLSVADGLIEGFYTHLNGFEETARLLSNPETRDRLRTALQDYFNRLIAGPYDLEYVEDRLRVGIVHRRIGLTPKWYVGAYAGLLVGLFRGIGRQLPGNSDEVIETCLSLLKVALLDVTLGMETYLDEDRQVIARLQRYGEKVLSGVPAGLLVLSADLRVLSSNRYFRKLMGDPQADYRGRPLEALFPTVPWWNAAARVIGAEDSRFEQLVTVADGGAERSFRLVLTGIPNTEQDQARALLTVDDVTEHEQDKATIRQAHDDLKQTQAHLLQSEKMASIGQLAAGVAHEINNPVGFVTSNLRTLSEYVDDLVKLVAAYEPLLSAAERDGAAAATAEAARVRQVLQQLDPTAMLADVKQLTKQSIDGLDRVRQIVQNLKSFSHVDDAQRVAFDVNAGLESTLTIVWNELKYKCEIVRDLRTVPPVTGFPQQINQVFMNLLVNAGQAMTAKGTIWVRSYSRDGHVVVEVEDTGSGIAREHLDKIFDPFFTTKPVGKGTGLGLSISYGIVQKHQGRIEVASEVGRGTCFRVWLPVATESRGEAPDTVAA